MSAKNGETADTSRPATEKIEVSLLEKRLEGMRDTQESVQGLSLWCQANKRHSTAIIDTWLKVLRKSPVEKRLTMFYLANDVVQHAKRKGDSTVLNQWAVAIQKATPHVRTPSSVSSAIIRIFKIWEERLVYSKDTVADLYALINNVPGKEKLIEVKRKPEIYTAEDEKVKGFQTASLVAKVKLAYRLKSHLGVTFRTKHYVNMNMEQLIASIKDRQHGMSVVDDIASLMEQCRASENKLQHEVDERRRIVEAAEVAIVYFENVRSEARIVNTAYKGFTERVKRCKDKADDMMNSFEDMERSPSAVMNTRHFEEDDDIQIILPPLSEASKYIEVVQSNLAKRDSLSSNISNTNYDSLHSTSAVTNNLTSSTPFTPTTPAAPPDPIPNMIQPSGYDAMAWTSETYNSMLTSIMQMHQQQQQQQQQQSGYALSTPMQQLLTNNSLQNYGYQTGNPNLVPQQQQLGHNDIGSIPLPPAVPPMAGGSNPPLPPTPQEPMHGNMGPPLPTTSLISPQYDPAYPSQFNTSAQESHFNSSAQESQFNSSGQENQFNSSAQDYNPEDYEQNSYDEPMSENYEPSSSSAPNTNNISLVQPEPQYNPSPARYHPYNNNKSPQHRFPRSDSHSSPRPRGPGPRPAPLLSPPAYGGGPRFGPRTPNATSPTTPRGGGNQFSGYQPRPRMVSNNSSVPLLGESPSQPPRSGIAANLLRIAGGMMDSPVPDQSSPSTSSTFGYNSNPFLDASSGGPERLNGTGDLGENKMYPSPQQQYYEKPHTPGRGGGFRPRGMMNSPQFKSPRMPMRGRGDRGGIGGFNRGGGGFRGRGMRGGAPGPRRGGW